MSAWNQSSVSDGSREKRAGMTVFDPAAAPPGLEHARERLDKLPLPRMLGYASGQLVEMVVSSMLTVFMLFYATVVCGLSGSLAGLAVGAGLVIDAILDPVIGSLSDGWRSRFGRRVPFMVVSLPLILVSFNLLFTAPVGLSGMALFGWMAGLSIALRVSLSIFSLPFQALGTELSDDYNERTSISAWRWGIGLLGTLATIVLGYGGFLSGPGGTMRREAYSALAMSLSVILLIGGLLAVRTAIRTLDRQHSPVPSDLTLSARVFGGISEVFANRTFRILFFSGLLFNIASGLDQAVSMHVATFFWRLPAEQIQPIALAAVLGLVLGAPLAGPLIKRTEKRTMMIVGMSGMLIGHATPLTLRLLGLLQLSGGDLSLLLSVVSLLTGISTGLAYVSAISCLPDAADEHEQIYGTRREGMYVAGWVFAGKAATGVGILVAGIVLDLVDFPSGMAERGAEAIAMIPAWKAETLAMVGGPGASLISMSGILLMLFYRIDKRAHARILADLHLRRSATPEGTVATTRQA